MVYGRLIFSRPSTLSRRLTISRKIYGLRWPRIIYTCVLGERPQPWFCLERYKRGNTGTLDGTFKITQTSDGRQKGHNYRSRAWRWKDCRAKGVRVGVSVCVEARWGLSNNSMTYVRQLERELVSIPPPCDLLRWINLSQTVESYHWCVTIGMNEWKIWFTCKSEMTNTLKTPCYKELPHIGNSKIRHALR